MRTHAFWFGGIMWYTLHLLTRQENGMKSGEASKIFAHKVAVAMTLPGTWSVRRTKLSDCATRQTTLAAPDPDA